MVMIPSTKPELRAAKPSREEFARLPRNPIFIVLDSLKMAHNIGTILRLADAVLVEKVYICGNTIVPPNYKIKQGSRGAERWVPWEYRQSAADVVTELRTRGVFIVSAELTESSTRYDRIAYRFPVCIVLGREYDGVSPQVLELSDVVVSLPVYGMSNSINVSATASVLVYYLLGEFESSA
jgi:tRNA G18 (ribose-2'-O)-methylase SpoU